MPFRFVNLPPLLPPLGQSDRPRAARRSGPTSCVLHFLQVLQSFLRGYVSLSASYQNVTHFLLQFLLHFRHLRHILSGSHFSRLVRAVPGDGVRRLLDVRGVELVRLPPPVVSGCQPVSPEHWPPGDSSPLPSPVLFFDRQCLRLVVWGLLFCAPSPAVPLVSLVASSALLGAVV